VYVSVGVGDLLGVGVIVGVMEGVAFGSGVYVSVGVDVIVGVMEGVALGSGVRVALAVGVGLTVGVGDVNGSCLSFRRAIWVNGLSLFSHQSFT
jgi:hypothetical protein